MSIERNQMNLGTPPHRIKPYEEYDQFIIGMEENGLYFVYSKDAIIDHLTQKFYHSEEIFTYNIQEAHSLALEFFYTQIKKLELDLHTPIFITRDHLFKLEDPKIH